MKDSKFYVQTLQVLSSRHANSNDDPHTVDAVRLEFAKKASKFNVPVKPRQSAPLEITERFLRYAKSIMWNQVGNHARDIGRDNAYINRHIDLFEMDFLACDLSDDVNYMMSVQQAGVIRDQLKAMPDQRPLQTWDTLFDESQADADEHIGSHGEIRRHVVRRATGMSYHTITKQLNVIRSIIEDSGGVDNCDSHFNIFAKPTCQDNA